MTDSAALGRIGSGDLSVSERAMARAGGIPSPDEYDDVEFLNRGRCNLSCGVDTTGFAQVAFFADDPGDFGDGSDGYGPTVTNATWGGTSGGTAFELTLAGAFDDWEWYDGAYITLTSNDGGFTSGETYAIESKTDGDTIVLVDAVSLNNGVALPAAGAATAVDFTVSSRGYSPLYVPLVAPFDSTSDNNMPGYSGVPAQSTYWNYCFAELPPGGLTDGAKFKATFTGRITVKNLTAHGNRKLYFVIDPQGSPFEQDLRENEAAVGRVRPTVVGWMAPKTTAAAVPWLVATTTERNGKVLVTAAANGLVTGDQVRLVSVKEDAFGDILDPTPDISNGQRYFVTQSDIDGDITDDTSEFFLSKEDPSTAYQPILYSGTSPGDDGEVAIVRFSRGSVKRIMFSFEFTPAQEYDTTRYFRLVIRAYADGRTTDTDQGVYWFADLYIYPYAEEAAWGGTRHFISITAANAPIHMAGVLSRTSPGNTMNTAGSGTEQLVGAPLMRQKSNQYQDDGVSVAFTGATWTEGTLTLSKAGLGTAANSNSSTRVRITGGDGTVGDYTIDTISAPDDIILDSSIGAAATTADGYHKSAETSFHCYETTMHDYGGAFDIVHIDEKPHDEGYLSIRIGSATWNGTGAPSGAVQPNGMRETGSPGPFAGFTYFPGARLRISGSVSGDFEPGYYTIASKYDNNQVILAADARLPLTVNSNDVVCDIDEYPFTSYLGEDAGAAVVNSYATLTKVRRGSEDIGEVIQHDNVLQRLWFVPYNDNHPEYGETLTLFTYQRRKINNTGSSWGWGWGFSSATWDPATRKLFRVGAFIGFEFVAADEVYISGGSGWTTGRYVIESRDDDYLILVAGQTGMGAASVSNMSGAVLKPVRTATVTVGRVDLGPQPTRLSARMAVAGPQNGDIELNVRQFSAKLERHRSR